MEFTAGEFSTFKEVLILIVLTLFALNALMFIATIVHRLYVDYRDRKYDRSYKKFRRYVEEVCGGGDLRIKPSGTVEYEALTDVLIDFLRETSYSAEECVLRIAEESGVINFLRRQANSFLLNTRVTALERLGYLNDSWAEKEIRKRILESERGWLAGRLAFAYSLLVYDLERLKFLMDAVSKSKEMSFKYLELIWENIITNFKRTGKVEDLISYIDEELTRYKDYERVLRAMVETAGMLRERSFAPLIEKIHDLFAEDDLMVLSTLRSLGTIESPAYCRLFLRSVSHRDWRIRAVACKYAYLCPFEVAIDKLRERLADESYYVRINAGKALASFGHCSMKVLKELAQSEDRFARDTARYLLEEMRLRE